MSRLLKVGMAVAVALAAAIPAASQAVEVNLGADFVSAYVWRGMTANDGVVFQPSIDVALPSGLGFNFWGNFDISDYDGAVEKREFSEVDLTISYTLPIEGPVSVTFGLSEFMFPTEGLYDAPELPEGHPEVDVVTKGRNTRELFLSLGYEPVDGLTLSAGVYQDINEVQGTYGDLSIAYAYSIKDMLTLEASAKIGVADKKFAKYYTEVDDVKAGFFDWGTQLAATCNACEGMEITAFIAYVGNVDKDVFPDEAKDTEVFGGISLLFSF